MKVSLLQFLLLSVFLLGNMDAKAQLNNNLTADELRIKPVSYTHLAPTKENGLRLPAPHSLPT